MRTLLAGIFVVAALATATAQQQPAAGKTPAPGTTANPQATRPAVPAPAKPESPQQPAANPDDVKSIDAIVHALYDVISGPPGPRNWERFHSLFATDARLMFNGKTKDGKIVLRTMTPQSYQERAGSFFLKEGFFETGIANKVDEFGTIAHVFSTYESRHEKDAKPFARGINSIQLVNDGQRWYVVTILWDEERPENPIPEKYLK